MARDFLAGVLNTDPKQRFTLKQIKEHPWFNSMDAPEIAEEKGPEISKDLLEEMQIRGFNKDYVKLCLQSNKHNHATTTYRLLRKKLGDVIEKPHPSPPPPGDERDEQLDSPMFNAEPPCEPVAQRP